MTKQQARFHLQPAAALLLLSLTAAACSSGAPGDGKNAATAHLSVNGIRFEGSQIGPTTVDDGRLRTSIGGHVLSVEQHRLHVDGANYGTLRPGDTVTVTASGTVLINGQPARRD